MADGTYKPIEDVKIGDKVQATDPATGKTRAERVTALIPGHGEKNLVNITVDADGKRGIKSGTVTATDGHPFWVKNDRKWVKAADLKPGMWLRTSAGTHVQVTATEHRKTRAQRVHNLTIANLHTYHVGAGVPVLVHNAGCVSSYSSHARDQMAERGLSEDMVEQTVRNGKKTRGNRPGTTKYKTRKLWVVVNKDGHVVSAGRN